MKRLLGCFMFALLLLIPSKVVFAAEQPDFDKKGSIDIYLRATAGNLVPGGSLEVYQVAYVNKTSKGYQYAYTSDFDKSGYSFDEDVADLTVELYNYAVDNKIQGEVYNNQTGMIEMNNLTAGLYLITNKVAPGGYNGITPFLVALPLQVNGTWIYDIDASPKMSLLSQTPIIIPGGGTGPESVPGGGNTPESVPGVDWNEGSVSGNLQSPATGEDESIALIIMISSFLLCIVHAFVGLCLTLKKKNNT